MRWRGKVKQQCAVFATLWCIHLRLRKIDNGEEGGRIERRDREEEKVERKGIPDFKPF
jgi:hypothetical protein